MAAYLVMAITITDEAEWRLYREAVLPLIGRFGGEHVTGPDKVELLEGGAGGRRLAMFAFPSREAIREFWSSPDYVPVRALREGAATLDVWAVSDA